MHFRHVVEGTKGRLIPTIDVRYCGWCTGVFPNVFEQVVSLAG